MKNLEKGLIIGILIFCSVVSVKAQNQKDTYFTSKTFHTTTYVEMVLSESKDIEIKILDAQSRDLVFTKELKSVKISRFKLDLKDLEKGQYVMVFMDSSGEILKEIITNKLK